VFATASKKDMKLNAKWEALAAKELKGHDVKETLVRETNEQLLVKPLYTAEDWKPPADLEVPGNSFSLCVKIF
jgi:methylmalonyl-CoA mutase N-terminal domain/subunit